MHRNHSKLLYIYFIIAALTYACSASKLDLSLNFQNDKPLYAETFQGVIGVDEFIDIRPQAVTSDAKKWLGFIPGALWLNFISEIPDTYTGFSYYNSGTFKIGFAHAIYKDIEGAKLFGKSIFLPNDRYAPIDYRLEGVLKRTTVKETGYYYGSGFYAWITRIVGLPYVSYEFSLDITLRLRRVDNNEIIWSHELKGERVDKYYNIYQLTGGKDGKHIISYNFSEILKEQMPSALETMGLALKNL